MSFYKRRTVFWTIGWLVGLFAFYLWGSGSQQTAEVLVLIRDVPAYAPLSPDWIDVRRVPKKYITESSFASLEQVVGRYSVWPMFKGELLNERRLVNEAEQIHQGQVVFRVPVQTGTVPTKSLTPGVEVGLIQVSSSGYGEHWNGRLLLPRVRVVDVHEARDQVIDAIDVSVTELEAVQIAEALQEGRIHVVMRHGPGTEDIESLDVFRTFQQLPNGEGES